MLGECAVDIDQYVAQLSDTIGLGVKATLQFKRQQGTKSVTVGRFVCTLKLLVTKKRFVLIFSQGRLSNGYYGGGKRRRYDAFTS